ncbi:hypothetical protein MMC17_002790 [Xylographa soralifera]|nr:hypothetical protein [Xylographa soralifera]
MSELPSTQSNAKQQAGLRYPLPPSAKAQALALVEQASFSGDLGTIISLIDKHHFSSEELQFALGSAVRGNQPQTIRYFLDQGVQIGQRAALAAARLKSLTVYQLLVQYRWDVNTPLGAGRTALAYVMRDETLVRWLLDHGADPNIGAPYTFVPSDSAPVTNSGDALNHAAASLSVATFDLLLAHGARLENSLPLHAAAEVAADAEAVVPMLQHLLSLGVDVNASDHVKGHAGLGTPLHYAIRAGRLAAVGFLVEHGADLAVRNSHHKTVVEEAQSWGHTQIVELLETALAMEKSESHT